MKTLGLLIASGLLSAATALIPDALSALPPFRPSNSERLTEKGRKSFAEGRFAEAVERFAAAAERRDDPVAIYNAGTAEIAAGRIDEGSARLGTLGGLDSAAALDALFNTGNGALMRQQWDDAIASYAEVLRRSPGDFDAKRNLEIALQRRLSSQQQRSQDGESRPQPMPSAGEEDQPSPPPPGSGEGREEMTPEEILRSIAQQEKEELQRMRRERARDRRVVGW
ncbi:MAG TPA: hypothetical protein VMS56_11025 [Thermoanaerobaculia bacterium]|nr:hypothetical protein [Thermoanaerobaculia bacterium]